MEIRRVLRLRQAMAQDRNKLARLSGELFVVMQKSFSDWGLSPGESEVALLLLKGLSMRDIAALRQVQEKTIRAQAASIYAKSGQAGRHELAAHFIGDLISSVPG
jgi:DNA-binding NarL/FixJ family response regulator